MTKPHDTRSTASPVCDVNAGTRRTGLASWPMLLLCASTLFACGERHVSDADTSSTSDGTPAGPEPGAPDEFCEPLDPDRVYLRHFEYGYGFMAVTDVEQPEATCLYYSGYQSDVPAALVARVDPSRVPDENPTARAST